MAAFWAVFIFGGSGPAITAHGSLDIKQEFQRNSKLYSLDFIWGILIFYTQVVFILFIRL
jgi:hypothetical protein